MLEQVRVRGEDFAGDGMRKLRLRRLLKGSVLGGLERRVEEVLVGSGNGRDGAGLGV